MDDILTNKTVFAFQVKKFPERFTREFIITTFKEGDKNFKRNFHSFHNSYSVSLECSDYDADAFYFKFSKLRNEAQQVTRFGNLLSRFFIGGSQKEKPTDVSFFAYYPKQSILLVLYNDRALKKVIAPLERYIREKFNENNIELIPIDFKEKFDDTFKKVNFVNKIIVKTAIKDIQHSSELKDMNTFAKLEDYGNKGNRILEFPFLKKYGKKVIPFIKELLLKNNEAESIMVTGDNIDEDILSKFLLRFPCHVRLDRNGLADFNDFKEKVKDIFLNNKDNSLAGFSHSS